MCVNGLVRPPRPVRVLVSRLGHIVGIRMRVICAALEVALDRTSYRLAKRRRIFGPIEDGPDCRQAVGTHGDHNCGAPLTGEVHRVAISTGVSAITRGGTFVGGAGWTSRRVPEDKSAITRGGTFVGGTG